MKKPRVLFPYTEAGFGHKMPMESIADEFEKLYGDKVECVRSVFYREGGDKKLIEFERRMCNSVVKNNKHTSLGFLATFCNNFFGIRLATWGAMAALCVGSRKCGYAHMDELAPDLVFSTHYSTNYYARHCGCKPLTMLYCPDVCLNPLYMYECDMTLVPTQKGYERALKSRRRKYDENNLKKVDFLIRNGAFTTPRDKIQARRNLGFDEDKFTVLLAEGGYGIGKMKKICEKILKRDLPVTLVPVCGKNDKLLEYFKSLKSKGNTDFRPVGLADNMFELLVAADVFCGKSGASMAAEPCFFGVPHVITKYASGIEKQNGIYYIKEIGSAIKEFNTTRAVKLIEDFTAHPEKLEPYKKAAESNHANFGATKCAHLIFELLCTRFPELKEGKDK